MLLRHNAGYGADIRFFDNNMDYYQKFYSMKRAKTISMLKDIKLENIPGDKFKYSDIDYMILCALIEKISGMSMDDYLQENIYRPLGIQNQILYTPLDKGFSQDNFAATERMGNTRDGAVYFNEIRNYTLQGEVHDEKAYYSMGSISGHAGLFSDAYALSILNQLLLNKGYFNNLIFFSEDIVDAFLTIYDDEKYQLGFLNAKSNKYLKDFVSDSTLYHYGWTGAATLIDIENNMAIILLTNKRHSPCNLDAFEGNDNFDTGKYAAIIEMVYDALN